MSSSFSLWLKLVRCGLHPFGHDSRFLELKLSPPTSRKDRVRCSSVTAASPRVTARSVASRVQRFFSCACSRSARSRSECDWFLDVSHAPSKPPTTGPTRSHRFFSPSKTAVTFAAVTVGTGDGSTNGSTLGGYPVRWPARAGLGGSRWTVQIREVIGVVAPAFMVTGAGGSGPPAT